MSRLTARAVKVMILGPPTVRLPIDAVSDAGAQPATTAADADADAPEAPAHTPAAQAIDLADPPPAPPRIGAHFADWDRPLPAGSGPPAVAADGGTVGPLEVLSALAAGLEHVQHGAGCQDAYAVRPLAHGLVACIADGVSNADLSDVGSRISADGAAAAVARLQDTRGDVLLKALDEADRALATAARERKAQARDLATTLVVAIVEPTPDGMRADVIAVGDSSAFVMRSPSDMTRIVGPEQVGSSVLKTSLPLKPRMAPERGQAELGGHDLLVLATDGLAADLMSSPAVRRWCWDQWTTAQSPLQAAAALGYRRQGTSDDLAAVVVRRWR